MISFFIKVAYITKILNHPENRSANDRLHALLHVRYCCLILWANPSRTQGKKYKVGLSVILWLTVTHGNVMAENSLVWRCFGLPYFQYNFKVFALQLPISWFVGNEVGWSEGSLFGGGIFVEKDCSNFIGKYSMHIAYILSYRNPIKVFSWSHTGRSLLLIQSTSRVWVLSCRSTPWKPSSNRRWETSLYRYYFKCSLHELAYNGQFLHKFSCFN